ncbi:hypothetical protein [Streptomyces sp. NPDC093610]|nr:hypothetical protein OG414_39735 [Streptomyces sp. NBC_01174]
MMIFLMRRGLPAFALTALPVLASPAFAGALTPLPVEELPFAS